MKYSGINRYKVLVTGGTRGIGYEIANIFLEQGAEVHITGTSEDGNRPSNSIYHSCDFSNTDSLENLCDTLKQLGLDILINNAAYARAEDRTPILDLNEDTFQKVMDIKFYYKLDFIFLAASAETHFVQMFSCFSRNSVEQPFSK